MNKQKKVIELIVYLIALIIGIVMLINGYYKQEDETIPESTSYAVDIKEQI